MDNEDFSRSLDIQLLEQSVSKKQLDEMVILFYNLKEHFESTPNPLYKMYISIFKNLVKHLPNLSLSDFRSLKKQFIFDSIKGLEKINPSDDTSNLHELIEKFFVIYKEILYKKTSFTFFDDLKLKTLLKLGLEQYETVF